MVKRECSEFWVLPILLLYKAISDVITSRGDGSGRQLGISMSQLTSLPGSWLGLLRLTTVRSMLVLWYFVIYHSLNREDNYQIQSVIYYALFCILRSSYLLKKFFIASKTTLISGQHLCADLKKTGTPKMYPVGHKEGQYLGSDFNSYTTESVPSMLSLTPYFGQPCQFGRGLG